MIPFASQRAGGQDLATHLMNAHDNEQIELFEMRGAIARDLHGAFAEWEAVAKALTRCRQYLCSLSINPDERQGRLTRAQYVDYIDRAETALDLTGQPRAIIFHVKQGEDGHKREHCHVVWSRIDLEQGRAVPLSFFKDKMMTVTREFARDHGLDLPPGYDRQDDERRNRQLSGYDGIKQKETGLSHEERMAAVTDAWQRSDTGRAFVNALADLGYILARGRNKTRVVLVDFYGHTTALTRLIDDPSVRARHVRGFLGPDYAPEALPSVEEAQDMAVQRREAIEAFEAARGEDDPATALDRDQTLRRQKLEDKLAALRRRQHEQRVLLAALHKAARQKLKFVYLAEQKSIRRRRARRKPTGLAAFLGRVTGVALIRRKVQRYRDRQRYGAYRAKRDALKQRQQDQRAALARRHELQAADLQRGLRALDRIEQRERQTLDTAALKAHRQAINARHEHMPAMTPVVKQHVETDGPAAGRHREFSLAQECERAAAEGKPDDRRRLAAAFGHVSGGQEEGDGEGDSTETLAPAAEGKIRRRRERRRRRRRLAADFERAADDGTGDGEGGGSADDLKPAAEAKLTRRRRRKERSARKRTDRKSERMQTFNESARGGEDDGSEGSATESPAPAAEMKIRRRRKRRRSRDLDREFNSVSGAGDGRVDDPDSAGPRRGRRRRYRGPDPPEGPGPPRPRRSRKPGLKPGR